MTVKRSRLRDEIRLEVRYEDLTPYGSALGGRADETIVKACATIVRHRSQYGLAYTVARSSRLLEDAMSRELAGLYAAPGKLREEFLHPPPALVRPAVLVVIGDGERADAIDLSTIDCRSLAPLLGDLQRGTERPGSPSGRYLFDRLEACGALTEDASVSDAIPAHDACFVGHATAMVNRGARILIDPFLFPHSPGYPPSYQPLRLATLLPLDAVFITHSHPDHFDPGTLLRLGAETAIYVPEVERESLLAIDMASRLEAFGFTNVHRIAAGTETSIGGARVIALPLFGEQPTTGDVLHPEVRNVGCTYLCESGNRRFLFLADSGADGTGDVRELASAARLRHGPIDAVFGGYRGFALYPIQYLFSSVARFLLFVPPSERAIRQKIMNDGDDLIDTAERCRTGIVVPYASGGAPWYWHRGLGCAPGAAPETSIDRPPEDLARLAARRSWCSEGPIASPAQVVIMRPGEVLRSEGDAFAVDRGPSQRWPYDAPGWMQVNVALTRTDGTIGENSRRLLQAVERQRESWRQAKGLRRFFFMRKTPGLRLRFLAGEDIADDLRELLDRLTREGIVDTWFRSVYEPETDRFGGAAGMDAAHAWFDADTTQFLVLDRLRLEGRALLPPEILCRWVASDLVGTLVPDRAEAGALWRLYRSSLAATPIEDPSTVLPSIESQPSAPSPEEVLVLEAYGKANRELAQEITRIHGRGELAAGLRSVLSALILFHFHRHGLALSSHLRIASSMIHAHADPTPP